MVWGVNYSFPFTSGKYIYHSLWNIIWKGQEVLYSFHMPAFFALSGALYFLTHKNYLDINQFLSVKAKRLLLPFILCAFFYMMPLKLLAGFYSLENIGAALNGMLFATGDAGHLWFLPTLFLNFVVVKVLEFFLI